MAIEDGVGEPVMDTQAMGTERVMAVGMGGGEGTPLSQATGKWMSHEDPTIHLQ